MKRIVTWFLSTISVVVLLFGYHTSTSSSLATSSPTSVVTGGSGGASSGGSSTTSGSGGSSGGSGGSGGPRHMGGSMTRTVTGSTADTQWGPVQVQLSISGGKITDVAVPQYPTGSSTDDAINSYALPILVQETLSAQSAHIDMVSGATVTSGGYLQSLQSALDQAGM